MPTDPVSEGTAAAAKKPKPKPKAPAPAPAATPAPAVQVAGQLPGPPAGVDFMQWLATQPQWVKDGWAKLAADKVTADTITTAKETYGYLGAYLDDPEIGPILLKSAREGWSQDRLRGALSATNWWKQTAQTARQWDSTKTTDPASAAAQVTQRVTDLRAAALNLGVNLSDAQLQVLATQSLREGWGQQQITNALGAEASGDPNTRHQLATATIGQSVRTMISDYGLPMSDAAVNKWTTDIAAGRATTESMRGWLIDQSSSLHPSIAQALKSGTTLKQYADPYIQIAAQTLGIAPESINLSDPKWLRSMDNVGEGGVRQPMSLNDWQTLLKTDRSYGYQYTKQANDSAWQMTQEIGRMFGKVA